MSFAFLVAVFALSAGAAAYVTALFGGGRVRVEERLEELVAKRSTRMRLGTEDIPPDADNQAGEPAARHEPRRALLERMDRVVSGSRRMESLASRLRRADLKLKVVEFVLIGVALALVLGMLLLLLGGPVLAPAGIAAGAWLPFLYLKGREDRRVKLFNQQLPDALSILANSLRSGYSILQAMDVVAREMPDPISREFDQTMKEIRVNIAPEDAFENLVRRVGTPDLDLAVTAVLIQRQVGGNLSEVLDKINGTIRDRVRILGEIKTLTAQGRISGVIVALLPVGLGLLFYVLNPAFMRPLFTHPLGWAILGVGVVMQVIGAVVIRKIVTIEV